MPRYFFNVHHPGKIQVDEIGTECATADEVRQSAMLLLPDLAREATPGAGDQFSYVVVVRGENGRPVFSATLSLTGLWLDEDKDRGEKHGQ